MIAGTLVIWLGLLAVIASILLYVGDNRILGPTGKPAAARLAFFVAAGSVIAASAILQGLLQMHRFDVNYVFHYSARGLNPFYLFATFWAGQEGSFLLWAFWISVLGIILAVKAGPAIERRVMPVYGGILAFLLLILTIKSPFVPYEVAAATSAQTNQLQGWLAQVAAIFHGSAAIPPADGNGLQPLLENPWMVIHPPTLFLGFSLTAVTFVYAVAGLVTGNFDAWYRRAWPWALSCFAILGFGIMLGGYWAYDTLGWGGFWGWDPVENGPLVPWLLMGAFVHGVQVQRVRGGLKKSVFLLGMLPFIATLYETLLTRTGILSNFSNHSFSTLGGAANNVILYGLVGTLALSILLLFVKRRKIVNESSVWEQVTSKEFAFTIAILLMIACALITGIGMSAPLLTGFAVTLGKAHPGIFYHSFPPYINVPDDIAGGSAHFNWPAAQAAVDSGYYNKANFPVAILIAFGLAIGPYLAWKSSKADDVAPLNGPWVLTVLLTLALFGVSYVLHVPLHAPMLLLFAASVFAVIANVSMLARRMRSAGGGIERTRTVGGFLAHAGAGVLLLGIVCLVTFQRIEDVDLYTGHPVALQTLPYTLTYTGMSSTLKDPENVLNFNVARRDGDAPVAGMRLDPTAPARAAATSAGSKAPDSFSISMPVAIRKQETMPTLLARPAIQTHYWGDLYFALKAGPEQVSPSRLIRFTLHQGETKVQDGYTYTFRKFEIRPAEAPTVAAAIKERRMPPVFPVGAVVDVVTPAGQKLTVEPWNVTSMDNPLGPDTPEVALPRPAAGTWWGLTFEKMNANMKGGGMNANSADLFVRDVSFAPLTRFTIEVSTRPMIWLVWLGTIMMTAGSLLATRRRALEARQAPAEDPAAPAADRVPSAGSGAGRVRRRQARTIAAAEAASIKEGR